jgi:hypothetical protein
MDSREEHIDIVGIANRYVSYTFEICRPQWLHINDVGYPPEVVYSTQENMALRYSRDLIADTLLMSIARDAGIMLILVPIWYTEESIKKSIDYSRSIL